MSTGGWTKYRVTIELRSKSGNISVRVGYQTSADPCAEDTPAAIGPTRIAEGRTTDSQGFVAIGTAIDAKPWIRFGLLVRNIASESGLENAKAGARVEFA